MRNFLLLQIMTIRFVFCCFFIKEEKRKENLYIERAMSLLLHARISTFKGRLERKNSKKRRKVQVHSKKKHYHGQLKFCISSQSKNQFIKRGRRKFFSIVFSNSFFHFFFFFLEGKDNAPVWLIKNRGVTKFAPLVLVATGTNRNQPPSPSSVESHF